MRYLITGADRSTGDNRSTIIFAISQDQALEKANSIGLLVENMKTLDTEVEDRAGPLPLKPKRPFFSINPTEVVLKKRLKLLITDPDNGNNTVLTDVFPDELPLDKIRIAISQSGGELTKIIILERFWVIQDKSSKTLNVLAAIGLLGEL